MDLTQGVRLTDIIGADAPSPQDYANARALLDAQFEAVDDPVWNQVIRLVRDRGLTRKEFSRAVDDLVARKSGYIPKGHTAPVWTVGDLLREAAAPVLYGYAWYLARLEESRDNAERIGVYRIPGHDKPAFAWRQDVGDRLPAWEGRPAINDDMRALRMTERPPQPERSRDTAEQIAHLQRALKAETRTEEMDREIKKQQADVRILQEENRKLRLEIEELTRMVDSLKRVRTDQMEAIRSLRERIQYLGEERKK